MIGACFDKFWQACRRALLAGDTAGVTADTLEALSTYCYRDVQTDQDWLWEQVCESCELDARSAAIRSGLLLFSGLKDVQLPAMLHQLKQHAMLVGLTQHTCIQLSPWCVQSEQASDSRQLRRALELLLGLAGTGGRLSESKPRLVDALKV